MKKTLVNIFGRNSIPIKILAILLFALKIFKSMSCVKKNKIKFFIKAFKDKCIFEFCLLKDNKNITRFFDRKYQFNYRDWFSININVWQKTLNPIEKIKYLEIGSFEGRSAVFVASLNNVKEITCVDTFQGSDEHNHIDFDLVYKNCLGNLNKSNKPFNLIKN